ncbi:hypothetical protein CRYUN_Cryun24cG0107500 [Craigia yunnanensis]
MALSSPPPSTTSLLVVLFLLSSTALLCESKLSLDYYSKTCPSFNKIMQETITNKQITSPTTAAGTIRLLFHDCLPNGCDGSILISSTAFNKAERDADINLSLPGDPFDLIVRAKTALELSCPNTVSCADILAVAARDLLTMLGGPYYNVYLGRKDSRFSQASSIEGKLPKPDMGMSKIINLFAASGFSIQEMVALSGAHTIGFSHCKEFSSNIGNDTHYNPRIYRRVWGFWNQIMDCMMILEQSLLWNCMQRIRTSSFKILLELCRSLVFMGSRLGGKERLGAGVMLLTEFSSCYYCLRW